MKTLYAKLGLAGLILAGLVVAGCLVSGTFVIVRDVDFSFDTHYGFYWYPVDLTEDSDWNKHKDEIDDIDAIGFELKLHNTTNEECTFNVWFSAPQGVFGLGEPPTSFDPSASGFVHVIKDLTVAGGATRTVTYSESLGLISDLAAFKALVKTGRFDYYGTGCASSLDEPFQADGKIIITVSASGS